MKVLEVQVLVTDEVSEEALNELGEWFQLCVPCEMNDDDEPLLIDVSFEIKNKPEYIESQEVLPPKPTSSKPIVGPDIEEFLKKPVTDVLRKNYN